MAILIRNEREPTGRSEPAFTQESARLYLLSLAEKVQYDSNELARQKQTAQAELRQLSRQQLNSLSGAIRASLELPENVRTMIETVDLRTLILNESRLKQEQLKKTVAYDPRSWTQEQIMTGASIGGTVLIGGGLAYGISKLFGKAKQKVNAVKEKVQSGTTWLGKTALIIGTTGLVALLGYIGITKGREYLMNYAENLKNDLAEKSKKVIDDAAKKAEKAVNAAGQKIDAAGQGVASGIDDAKKKVEERVEGMKDAKKPDAPSEEEKKKADRLAEGEQMKNEVLEFGSIPVIARALVSMTPSKEWTLSERTKIQLIKDVLHKNWNRPMKDIFGSVRRPKVLGAIETSLFELPAGTSAQDKANRMRAAHFVIDACFDHRSKISGADSMSLKDFINAAVGSHAVVGRIAENVQANGGDTFKAIQSLSLDTDSLSNLDSGLAAEFESFSKEVPSLNVGFLDLIQAARTLNGNVSGVLQETENETDTAAQKTIRRLCISMEKEQTHRYMLPFFHENFPEDEWSNDTKKNLEVVKKYLLDRMSVQQAIRMYLYARMMKKGNPAALALMQTEITHFTGSREEGFGGMKWKSQIAEAGSKAWNASWSELEEVNLGIPRDVIQKGEEALKWIIPYGTSSLVQKSIKGAEEAVGTVIVAGKQIAKHPKTAVGVVAGTYGVSQLIVKPVWNAGEDMKGVARPSAFAEKLRNAGQTKLKRLRFHNLAHARNVLGKAVEKIDDILRAGASAAGPLNAEQQLFAQFLNGPRTEQALMEFEAELIKRGANMGKLKQYLDTLKADLKILREFRIGSRIASLSNRIPQRLWLGMRELRNAPSAGLKVLKGVGKILPIGISAYETYNYAVHDYPTLKKQFTLETDPLKRKVIWNQMHSQELNLMIGTASAPFMKNPYGALIFLGNMARQEANDSIVEGTNYMLKDRKDMQHDAPGELLRTVQKSAPDSKVTWGQWLATTTFVDGEALIAKGMLPLPSNLVPNGKALDNKGIKSMGKTFDAANTSTRSEAYAAYFKQNAVMLPPVTEGMLTEAEAMDPALSERRLKLLAEDQANNFTQSALSYLQRVTGNTFVTVSPEILHRAETYAYRCTLDWRLQMLGEKSDFTQQDWTKKEALITEAIEAEKDERIAEANEEIESGEDPMDVLPLFYLESIKDDLATCEANVLGAKYSYSWSVRVWKSDDEMQRIARARYADNITAALEKICAVTAPITKESFEAGRQVLLKILQEKPDTFAYDGVHSKRRAEFAEIGANPGLLSFDGMLGYLQTYEPKTAVSPEKKSQTAAPLVAGKKNQAPPAKEDGVTEKKQAI